MRKIRDDHPHRVVLQVDDPRRFGQALMGLTHIQELKVLGPESLEFVTVKPEAAYRELAALVVETGVPVRRVDSLDHTLDQIGKTLHAATASPIDNPVEATQVLVNKLFDREDDMETNYEQLEVAERKSKTSIKGPLEALRAMRRKTAGGGDPEENGEKSKLDAKTKNNMKLLKELKNKEKS